MRRVLLLVTALATAVAIAILFWWVWWGRDYAEIREARALVSETLADSESARFRSEHVVWLEDGQVIVCGQVNGKNRFGAYVGFGDYHFMTLNSENYLFVQGSGMMAPASAVNGSQPSEMILKCP